jgi:hypothetical protein
LTRGGVYICVILFAPGELMGLFRKTRGEALAGGRR